MSEFSIRPLGPFFGVEVIGLEPRIPLDQPVVERLRELFDEKGVLLFRGMEADLTFQTYLSYALIGQSVPSGSESAAPAREQREYYVSNRVPDSGAPFGRLMFHTDMMWREDAFQLLSLYGVDVEEPAQGTSFVSTVHGWETLPADLRARIEGKFAIHGQDAGYDSRAGVDGDVLVSKFDEVETVRLPVGWQHPRTGKTMLYVAQQFTQRIDGMTDAESEALLEELFQHLYAQQNVLEHKWREGDLVMWDNLALQHARPNVEIDGPARTLRKTMVPMPKLPNQRPDLAKVREGTA